MPFGIVQGISSSPGITPAAITGANNNYNPGAVPYSTVWLALSAAASLTGFAAMPADSEVTIVNISTAQARILTLNHQNAGSTASNRFILPNGLDWFIPAGGAATLKYSGASARWYLVGWCGNQFPAGTSAAPGIVVGSDIDQGLYSFSSVVGMTIDGTTAMYWGANAGQTNANQLFTTGQIANGYTEVNGNAIISPAAIGANQTDYNPASLASVSTIRQDVSAACFINSLVGPGGSATGGRRIRLHNISATAANTLTLRHDDGATGTAAYRFLCSGAANVVIPRLSCVDLEYDSVSSRWRVFVGF